MFRRRLDLLNDRLRHNGTDPAPARA